jgi:DNA-directed RNA polymerase sigma subunit (sigma70/sigma32)
MPKGSGSPPTRQSILEAIKNGARLWQSLDSDKIYLEIDEDFIESVRDRHIQANTKTVSNHLIKEMVESNLLEAIEKENRIIYEPTKKATETLYERQRKYHESRKGVESVFKYNESDRRRITNRWLQQDRRGTLNPNRANEFREVYGDPEVVLNKLTHQQRQVIEIYCGLLDNPPISIDAVAKRMNLSLNEVKKLKSSGLKKL